MNNNINFRHQKKNKKTMKMLLTLAFAVLAIFPRPSHAMEQNGNVILLMLDGVRWQEVFKGTNSILDFFRPHHFIFDQLFGDLKSGGFITGNKNENDGMTVSNSRLLSLPGYQSIMSGAVQPCRDNSCDRISVETFEEHIVQQLGLPRTQVATIASWGSIRYAVEHQVGTTFVNSGNEALNDGTEDLMVEAINKEQLKNPPPEGDTRYDEYTYAHAVHYIKKHQPKFLFISLNDADELGHQQRYHSYVEKLKQYDHWIADLKSTLADLGDYGQNTTLIVTTDHGRGRGLTWGSHGALFASSKNVWLYGRNPKIKSVQTSPSQKNYTHIDIRPTIETLVGVNPIGAGRVISELVGE